MDEHIIKSLVLYQIYYTRLVTQELFIEQI